MASGLSNAGWLRKQQDFNLTPLGYAGSLSVDRNKPQSRGQSRIGKHLQRGALILQQSFRYPEYHADDAIVASGTTHRAVVTVDYHWFSCVRRDCRRRIRLADVRHLAGPLGLLGGLAVTLTVGTDISRRRGPHRRRARRAALNPRDVGATA
jgi:hypothetical protein